MKKCPTCNKEFDDAMRFCQTDGTPLVEAAPPVDPYKTMVARPEDIAAAVPPISASAERGPEPEPEAAEPEEVLEIPPADPKKTMYASEDEIRSAMAEADSSAVDEPSAEPEPAPPAFIAAPAEERVDSEFSKTTPPIPSPFGAPPAPPEPIAPEPETPSFAQPEPPAPAFNPFNDPAPAVDAPIAQAEWTPPPAAQDQARPDKAMQNPQYQPGSGLPAGKQNQTLAIVSLVSGILGLTLCCGWFIPSLVAVITGFMARGKASNDPANFGGAGLALGGLITGVIGVIGSLIVLAYVVLNFAMIAAMMAGQA